MFKKHFCFWGKSQVKDVAGCLFDRLRGQVASYIFLLKIISRVGTYQLAEGAVCDEAREDAWAKSPERPPCAVVKVLRAENNPGLRAFEEGFNN